MTVSEFSTKGGLARPGGILSHCSNPYQGFTDDSSEDASIDSSEDASVDQMIDAPFQSDSGQPDGIGT